jgi:hypothetical protein
VLTVAVSPRNGQFPAQPVKSQDSLLALALPRMPVLRQQPDPPKEFPMVTSDRVEAVIETIRPLLQAEGADIEVLQVDRHAAQVRVTGLCSCAPKATPMAGVNGGASPALSTLTPISLDDRLLELERSLITWALTASRGNKSRAAALLRVKRSTLGDRIRHCGLEPSTVTRTETRGGTQADATGPA